MSTRLLIAGRAWAALAAATLALAGCVATPEATPERDAEAKRFIPRPGAATIYVYRPGFPSADRNDPALHVDDRLIGETLPGTFYRVEVPPGRHVLHAFGSSGSQVEIDTQAGELHFVALEVSGSQSRFVRVAPDAGRREIVRCCVLLEIWAPGQRPLFRQFEGSGGKK